jgi:hypothetical protein
MCLQFEALRGENYEQHLHLITIKGAFPLGANTWCPGLIVIVRECEPFFIWCLFTRTG